jgi:hypothetical protein
VEVRSFSDFVPAAAATLSLRGSQGRAQPRPPLRSPQVALARHFRARLRVALRCAPARPLPRLRVAGALLPTVRLRAPSDAPARRKPVAPKGARRSASRAERRMAARRKQRQRPRGPLKGPRQVQRRPARLRARMRCYLALQADIATISRHAAFKKIDTVGALEIDAPASACYPSAIPQRLGV